MIGARINIFAATANDYGDLLRWIFGRMQLELGNCELFFRSLKLNRHMYHTMPQPNFRRNSHHRSCHGFSVVLSKSFSLSVCALC